MNSTAKVSVIISSYNHKKYLVEAVESVMAQTVRVHEIIIADDGSSDGSVETIKEYMNRCPGWIKGIFQPQNVGIPRNRNAALKTVTGDYVYILDGDDRFLPKNVETMLAALHENPGAQCVYGNIRIIDSEGEYMGVRDGEPQPSGNIFFRTALAKFGMLRNMLMDYGLLKQVGFLDERLPRYDGFELTLRLTRQCSVAYVFEPLAEYRVHTKSDSSGLNGKDHLDDLSIIYEKMQPLIVHLPEAQQEAIQHTWQAFILRFFIQHKTETEFLDYINALEHVPHDRRDHRDRQLKRFVAHMKKTFGDMDLYEESTLLGVPHETGGTLPDAAAETLRNSYSYRIGHGLLFPFKLIKRALQK